MIIIIGFVGLVHTCICNIILAVAYWQQSYFEVVQARSCLIVISVLLGLSFILPLACFVVIHVVQYARIRKKMNEILNIVINRREDRRVRKQFKFTDNLTDARGFILGSTVTHDTVTQ